MAHFYVVFVIALLNANFAMVSCETTKATSCYLCAGTHCLDFSEEFVEQVNCSSIPLADQTKMMSNYLSSSDLSKLINVTDIATVDIDWACLKMVVKNEELNDGKKVGFRTCFPRNVHTKSSCDWLGHLGEVLFTDVESCNICSDNLCNSALGSVSSLMLIGVVLLVFQMCSC